jgi:hypothetical protein
MNRIEREQQAAVRRDLLLSMLRSPSAHTADVDRRNGLARSTMPWDEPPLVRVKMKFRVGRFTCELSLDDNGEVRAQWLPWQPKYLIRAERVQYQAGRTAFLERDNPGSIASVVDRLSGVEPLA